MVQQGTNLAAEGTLGLAQGERQRTHTTKALCVCGVCVCVCVCVAQLTVRWQNAA